MIDIYNDKTIKLHYPRGSIIYNSAMYYYYYIKGDEIPYLSLSGYYKMIKIYTLYK